MVTAPAFYADKCDYFNVNGMPNMKKKVNKDRYGPSGLNIKQVQKNSIEMLLKKDWLSKINLILTQKAEFMKTNLIENFSCYAYRI